MISSDLTNATFILPYIKEIEFDADLVGYVQNNHTSQYYNLRTSL